MRKLRIRDDSSTLIGISSEAGFWCVDRSCLVNFGYDGEIVPFSLTIISKIKKLKKLFTFCAKYVIIYIENKERQLKMTTKELIKLLQRLDPSGNKEVVFGIDYDGEYEKETIVGAETYDDNEVVLYYQ